MTDRVRVDWMVPGKEWAKFRGYVHDEHGAVDGWLGREVEAAMNEYIDDDDYEAVEEKVDELLEAAGRSPERLSDKQNTDDLSEQETTRVTVWVAETTKDLFRSWVREHEEDRLGLTLARALREHRHGGRCDRILRKLDAVTDDAVDVLSELNPGETDMTPREKRTVAICKQLGDQFTEDDLQEAMDDVGIGRTVRDDYRELVLDRTGCVPHPEADEVYVPEQVADRIAGNNPETPTPEYERTDYSRLDPEEKVDAVRIELVRLAVAQKRGQIGWKHVQQVFRGDTEPTRDTCRKYLRLAANADGFTLVSKNGERLLRLHDLWGAPEYVLEYVDLPDEGSGHTLSYERQQNPGTAVRAD